MPTTHQLFIGLHCYISALVALAIIAIDAPDRVAGRYLGRAAELTESPTLATQPRPANCLPTNPTALDRLTASCHFSGVLLDVALDANRAAVNGDDRWADERFEVAADYLRRAARTARIS